MEDMTAIIAALRNAGMGAQQGVGGGMGMPMDPAQRAEMLKRQAWMDAMKQRGGTSIGGVMGSRGPNAAALYEAR